MATKRVGILTSGGDCAGLNAVIRAATHAALQKKWEIIGIKQGIYGLIHQPPQYVPLNYSFDGLGPALLRMGGTFLGTTNQGDPFKIQMPDGTYQDKSDAFIRGYHSLELNALIGIGGDGSLDKLRRLTLKGNIPFIGIPKTIDNDIGLTDSLGFETAVAVATEALDRLQPTAASHSRVMILEVMGRDAGHIALHAGIAGGADVILIPEIPFLVEKILDHINTIKKHGRNFSLIIIAEAAKPIDHSAVTHDDKKGYKRYGGIGQFLAEALEKHVNADVRAMALGHVQRGGQPVARDRLLAAAFGVHAIELIEAGKSDQMVAWQNRAVVSIPLEEGIASYEMVKKEGQMVRTARGLGISFGD